MWVLILGRPKVMKSYTHRITLRSLWTHSRSRGTQKQSTGLLGTRQKQAFGEQKRSRKCNILRTHNFCRHQSEATRTHQNGSWTPSKSAASAASRGIFAEKVCGCILIGFGHAGTRRRTRTPNAHWTHIGMEVREALILILPIS